MITKATCEFIQAHLAAPAMRPGSDFKEFAPKIHCADGTHLSVQASETHYCEPRVNYAMFGFEKVEVGFPSSEPPESWAGLFDGDWGTDDRTDSVYGWVPIALVVDYINDHGGLA